MKLRSLLRVLPLALLLALPAPALADPFGELPFKSLDDSALCLRATGAPGEVVGLTGDKLSVLHADTEQVSTLRSVSSGFSGECHGIAGQSGGALVVAQSDDSGVSAAVSDPGGQLGASVWLDTGERSVLLDLFAAAVAPSGEAVVVAFEQQENAYMRSRLRVFRRAPGGGFDRGRPITRWEDEPEFEEFVAAVDAGGRFTLEYARKVRRGVEFRVATAAPGEPFRPAELVARERRFVAPSSLAVAADGRALLAFGTRSGVKVAERGPGAERFGAPVSIRAAHVPESAISASVGNGGGAVVAWRTWEHMRAAVRTTAGAFGSAFDLAPVTDLDDAPFLDFYEPDPPHHPDAVLATAVDGSRYMVTWRDPGMPQVHGTTGALSGGPIEHFVLGAPLRPIISQTPVQLDDGRLAVAWMDDDATSDSGMLRRGRVHIAVPGLVSADPPPPQISVPQQKRQRLRSDSVWKLPVRCAGACDVRVDVSPSGDSAVLSLDQAGSLEFSFSARPLLWSGRAGRRTLTALVRVSAPGSRVTTTRRVRVPVTLIATRAK